MAANSKIEWTDQTWNPVVGCSKVSPGCAHCYAETMGFRLRQMALADIAAGRNPDRTRHYIDAVDEHGRWSGTLVPVPEALADPLGWKKPRMVFVNSMSDLFHADVKHEFVAQVLGVITYCRQHTFQVLTKRPFQMAGAMHFLSLEYCLKAAGLAPDFEPQWPPENLWLGTSIESRKYLHRADELRACPAAVRFLSLEPLLEDLGELDLTGIDQVIVGGESGPGARAMKPQWVRNIRDQCVIAGVPFFFKQWGGVQKAAHGRELDGRTWDEQPEVGGLAQSREVVK